jgi:hypothetical protein
MPRVAAATTPGVFVTAKPRMAAAKTPDAPAGARQIEPRRETVGDRRPLAALAALGGQALRDDRAKLFAAPAAKAARIGEQAEP